MVTEDYDSSQLYKMRHSAAHVTAEAVLKMFPEGKLGIGPPIENGFYYDFDLPRPLTPDDLDAIEDHMRARVATASPFEFRVVSAAEARELFHDQPYKLELIEQLAARGEEISVYHHGDFTDLCRGPHVHDTSELGAFKLMSVAGAYWRGDEHNPMLQRVYGALFPTQEELDAYQEHLEEAKKRDHRRLGRELGLFVFSDSSSATMSARASRCSCPRARCCATSWKGSCATRRNATATSMSGRVMWSRRNCTAAPVTWSTTAT